MYILIVSERPGNGAVSVAAVIEPGIMTPNGYRRIYSSESMDAIKRRAIEWLYDSIRRKGDFGQLEECRVFNPTNYNAVWAAFV